MTISRTDYSEFDILNTISYPSYMDKVNPLNQTCNEKKLIKINISLKHIISYKNKYLAFKYVDLKHILKKCC